MNVRGELRRLPYLAAVVLVLLAVVVLAVRLAALVLALVSDGFERAESVLAERCGTTPLGGRVIVLPTDPRPAPCGGAR